MKEVKKLKIQSNEQQALSVQGANGCGNFYINDN